MVEDNAVDTTSAGKRKKESKTFTPITLCTGGKGTPWTFPKNILEDAIRVAKAIEDKNGGNPIRTFTPSNGQP